jgi:hypothetical protein
VNIKAYKCDTLFHDLPPWLWLCAVVICISQHNPRLQGWQVFLFLRFN